MPPALSIRTRALVALAALVMPLTPAFAQRGGGTGRGRASGPPQGAQPTDSVLSGRRGGGNEGASGRDIAALAEAPPVTTHHTMNLHGQSIAYTASAGMLPMRDRQTDVIEGGMYFVAYTRDGANPATRPVTFAFNGGPGSATVWLHLGAFGPKHVKLESDGSAPPPPYTFEDNPNTLLDQTDLVFIDPIGTGYSRAARPDLGQKFWGLDEDIASVGEFIRLYLTRFDRMGSPKFLAGESYGTTRAAGLSGWLADQGIALNGVILLSTVLDFQAISQSRGNDLAFVNFLPTYTAVAWYHKKLSADLQRMSLEAATAASEKWALNDYANALLKGSRLTAAERTATEDQLVRFTGLPRDVVEQNDLRVSLGTFNSELLRDERKTVGRLDGRFTAFAALAGGRGGGVGDPSEAAIRNTFTPVLTDYNRRELNYKNDDIYYILGGGIGRWNYPQNQFATVVPNLERAFAKNAYMRLFVAEGYYDAATPYFSVEYTLAHLSVDPAVRQHNITTERYAAGHMMYIDEPSMKKLRSDLNRFISAAVSQAAIP